jgi:hypothetical protein
MPDTGTNRTISRLNTGFPEYLDYGKLRESAVRYLGELSGKIWTDHNEHDPGITILESLIYAILDLGYRTNLPAGDLFTRDPEDKTPDNNFFRASKILANNPLTITDYRKLLVDLEGVKNAWLEPDGSIPADFCNTMQKPDNTSVLRENISERSYVQEVINPCKCNNLNGLYHVYVELEDDIEKNKHLYDKTIRSIKNSLMAHRNLCEDFIDIKVLCRLELGVCAEIDLADDAVVEDIYLELVEILREYMSPSPKFYSLRQLLDKHKTIDEIYAGRPYNIKGSHGFVDIDEFEKIKLRKELHLSDVYHLLSEIKGINRVRNLGWIESCTNKKSSPEWTLKLPEHYVPYFLPECSGIIFTRNGLPFKADLKKFEGYLKTRWPGSKRAWYDENSSFLNPPIPEGTYRKDLADYYSIQNEFPRVYGIKKGSLGEGEPDKRKAQALQLQGFLLFFDQLLANYLAQLKNMRSLFSMRSGKNQSDNHTYFVNQLTNVPQIEKLLRFRLDDNSEGQLAIGQTVAFPVSREIIQKYIDNDILWKKNPEGNCSGEEDFPHYNFCFAQQRDLAITQLMDDFLFGNYEPVFIRNEEGCWFFYFFTTSSVISLVSRKTYKDQKKAADAASSIKYTATFSENYRSYMNRDPLGEEYFSFDVDLNLDVYLKYLQLIIEDKDLYVSRRQDFLNHLLSRFAESFTDYALLTSPFVDENDLSKQQIKAGERFLNLYDDLSSNRGKAYDYLKDKWKSANISGFEKRVKALAGIEDLNRHYLCNFVVEPADKLYELSIQLFDMKFSVADKTFNEKTGFNALKSIYNKLLSPVFEYEYLSHEKQYRVFIRDDCGNKFMLQKSFHQEDDAEKYIDNLDAAFKFHPDLKKDVFISRYIHKIIFTGHDDKPVAESSEHFDDKQVAEHFARQVSEKLSGHLKNDAEFVIIQGARIPARLIPVSTTEYPFIFLNEDKFEFRQVDVIRFKETRKRFSILDKKTTFQFDSLELFSDRKTAKNVYQTILSLLPVKSSYSVEENRQTGEWELFIKSGGKKIARFLDTFASGELAENRTNDLLREINTYTYRLSVSGPQPEEWEFRYHSGDIQGNSVDYVSRGKFRSYEHAAETAVHFYSRVKDLAVASGKELLLRLKQDKMTVSAVAPLETPGPEDVKKARAVLASAKRLHSQITDNSEKKLLSVLEKNRINPGEDYIYKLVDKDNLQAIHPVQNPVLDKNEAEALKNELIQKAQNGYKYIDISLGKDIVRKRKHPDSILYHYLIKCTNRKYTRGRLAGTDLILFESTSGYQSSDEAVSAFMAEYLPILKYARYEKNYGTGRQISTTELLLEAGDICNDKGSIVFIPKETSMEFGNYEVQKELAPLAASYPVRYVRKNKYAFVLGRHDKKAGTFITDWKSLKEYRTSTLAMQSFQFFLNLLKYPGNFYLELSEIQCDFRIYIREVLAISAHGFATPEDAWGEQGVEKFICVSQSENGFHNYENRQTCKPGFYVACGNTGLRHPCNYDTEPRRDRVLDSLYQSSGFSFFDLVRSVDKNRIVLTNLDKKPLAIINMDDERGLNYNGCEWLIRFAENVYDDNNFIKREGRVYLVYRYKGASDHQERYYRLAEPVDPGINIRKWKQELRRIACYFPVKRIGNICNPEGKEQFKVQIKLPGFDRCEEYPCQPQEKNDDCKPSCHIAWVSDCCFDDCCQALDFYLYSLLLIKQFRNYRRVFECNCGSYGIEIHPQLTVKEKKEFIRKTTEFVRQNNICYGDWNNEYMAAARKQKLYCSSDIIAINPQYYSSHEMVCEAVERSKRLINAEGLHLVEHILLRPRCKDKNGNYIECDCDGLPKPAINTDNYCSFQWKPGGAVDPCESEKTICLTPGCDPYSFIATLILPAWPQRFRSVSGRKVFEKLMQREAPAHILLRILWLKPRDFCCTEFNYKLWIEWMGRKLCDPYYTNCNFLKLLFSKRFLPLPDCEECIPCRCDDSLLTSCSPDLKDPCAGRDVLQNINDLYDWSDKEEYDYRHCEGLRREALRQDEVVHVAREAISPADIKELKDSSRLAETRASLFEKHISDIVKAYPGKEIIGKTLSFLKKTDPAPEEFSALIEDILRDKTNSAKGIKGLNKSQKQVVIESITWKFLDSATLINRDIESVSSVRGRFRYMKDKGLNMQAVFDGWGSEEVMEAEPDEDFRKIRKWLLGK